MKIRVTEINAWERERWTYILDSEVIGAHCVNLLVWFFKYANEEFQRQYDNAPYTNYGFGGRIKMFAASKYVMTFYDSIETDEKSGNLVLVHEKERLQLNGRPTYKEGGDFTNRKISSRRLRGALNEIRKKKTNRLYKDFESLFLKS